MRRSVNPMQDRPSGRSESAGRPPAGIPPLELAMSQQGPALCASLQAIYRRIFANPDSLGELLADTCVQHAGRVALDFGQIVKHVLHVRGRVKSIEYSVSHAVAQAGAIADRHIVEMTLHDHRSVTIEVLCLMRVADGKIVELYESSEVLRGDEALGALATAVE